MKMRNYHCVQLYLKTVERMTEFDISFSFSDLVKSGKIESRHRELKLVQSKNDIEIPHVKLVAKPEQL